MAWYSVGRVGMDRRTFLRVTATTGVVALLAACTPTKPQQNQWGIVSQAGYQYSYDMNTGNGWYPALFGAPNLWGVDGNGKFTHTFETDGYKQALSFAVD